MRDTNGAGASHRPVMVEEVLYYLKAEKGKVVFDGTVGAGGHAQAIAERIAPGGRLVAVDRDPEAIAEAKERLGEMDTQVSYYREDYRDIRSILDDAMIDSVDGILLDLGVSSSQFDRPERGFSFREDGPLDMRMDQTTGRTAADFLNTASEGEISRVLYQYGEERWARRIAQFIREARERRPIRTTQELVKVIEDAVPAGARRGRKHPARKTFQALRILVNDELEDLKEGLEEGIKCLAPAGRIVVLTYHSLEDRIVKSTFNSLAKGQDCPPGMPLESVPVLSVLTRKPVTPSDSEIEGNPRARSAKLRAAEKTAA